MPLTQNKLNVSWLVLITLLVACQSQIALPPSSDNTALNHWLVSGKAGFIQMGQVRSARFHWQQEGTSFHITLSGPLGVGKMMIEGQPGLVTLQTDKGKYSASTANELLTKLTGLPLPVDWLRYWILGTPVSHLAFDIQAYDEHHRLRVFKQAGWVVRYEGYQAVQGYLLPTRIFFEKEDTTVRLVVKNWKL